MPMFFHECVSVHVSDSDKAEEARVVLSSVIRTILNIIMP